MARASPRSMRAIRSVETIELCRSFRCPPRVCQVAAANQRPRKRPRYVP
jgi:hypothetical protein